MKSLDETITKIKDKNNNNILNLINDEKNINIFSENTKILLKNIKQNYIKNMGEYSNYISFLSLSQRNNNSDKKFGENSINNNSTNYYNNNNNKKFYLNDIFNKSFDKQNRIKSNEKMNKMKNKNIFLCKSQNYFDDNKLILNNSSKSLKTRNSSNKEKKINLNNFHLPLNKYQRINEKDIKKQVLFNKKHINEKDFEIKSRNKNLYQDNNILETNNMSYIKQNNSLKKEISYYRNLVNLLYKNNNNNSNNILLSNKLKIKEKEIISKNNQIKQLYKEIEKYKFKIRFMSKNENINSEMTKKLVKSQRLKNSTTSKESNQRLKTESFLSSKITLNNSINSSFIKENNKTDRGKGNSNIKSEKSDNLNYIKRFKFLEKENNLIKSKLNNINLEMNQKNKLLENEKNLILKEKLLLESKLKNEIIKNKELNQKIQNQKITYELEISKINDKRMELSKFLSNKNEEIIELQQELMIKNKENNNKKEIETKLGESDKMKNYYNKLINEKENIILKLNNEIKMLKEKNEILNKHIEIKTKEETYLTNNIKQLEVEISQRKRNNNTIDSEKKNEYESKIKKLKEENDGLKEFAIKQKKVLIESEKKDEKIYSIQRENDILKQYFIDMEIPLPNLAVEQSPRVSKSKKDKERIKSFQSKFTEEECFNILMQLNEAKKEIISLKKKNEELFNDLDSKKLKNDCFDNNSTTKPLSNYEEEFDLKKMAKGMKDKNRSQDMNIDYPGIQQIKEKYRELDFYYNSLEDLVKKMLLNITCTNKNKTYISQLCKIVGFGEDLTSKILNNKVKKGIMNIFG